MEEVTEVSSSSSPLHSASLPASEKLVLSPSLSDAVESTRELEGLAFLLDSRFLDPTASSALPLFQDKCGRPAVYKTSIASDKGQKLKCSEQVRAPVVARVVPLFIPGRRAGGLQGGFTGQLRQARCLEDGAMQLRAKAACDYCRVSKVRCDEAKPCSRCSLNGLSCQTSQSMLPEHKDMIVKDLQFLQRPQVKRACEACRSSKLKCDESRPCSRCKRGHFRCD
eukprot:525212-Hanusia_phi.AAC.9